MNNETRDNLERSPETTAQNQTARSRFSEEFQESATNTSIDGGKSNKHSSEKILPELGISNSGADNSANIGKSKDIQEINEEASKIADLLLDKGSFGSMEDQKAVSTAVRDALDKGMSSKLIDEINRQLLSEGSDLHLNMKYLYSHKNMPPTVVYGLQLNSGNANVDEMRVSHQQKWRRCPH